MIPTRTLAAASLALFAVVATPGAAFAEPYPPTSGASVVSVACASTFIAGEDYFQPHESVTVEIISQSAGTAASTAVLSAAADGSLTYTLPTATAVDGQYELTTWGTVSPARGPLLYSPALECLASSPAAEQASETELPDTGVDLSWLWLSGGLLFTGFLALGATRLVRRRSV